MVIEITLVYAEIFTILASIALVLSTFSIKNKTKGWKIISPAFLGLIVQATGSIMTTMEAVAEIGEILHWLGLSILTIGLSIGFLYLSKEISDRGG